jgi:nitrite reductase (NADH) large subunit
MGMEYLIIGNSAAGISAARAIRQKDREGRITLFSDEPYPYYSRLLLTYFIGGKVSRSQLFAGADDLVRGLDLRTELSCPIVEISPSRNEITAADGRRFPFDRLLLATGAAAVTPPIAGDDLQGVSPLRTLQHAERILEKVRPGGEAVILGGGLVGMQTAQALSLRGMGVTIVLSSDRLLSRNLDGPGAAILQTAAEKAGVKILTRKQAREITRGRGSLRVVLEGGEMLPGELVILAKGVEPRTNFLPAAGLLVARGARVDRFLKTSRADIFAAGDVAEVRDPLCRGNGLNPIWPKAIEQGRLAGLNMIGMDAPYSGSVVMNVTELFGVRVAAIGRVEAGTESRILTFHDPGKRVYKKFLLRGDVLEGVILLGDVADCGILHRLIRTGSDASPLLPRLMNGSAGLANALIRRSADCGMENRRDESLMIS